MSKDLTRFEQAGEPGYNDDSSTLDQFAHHQLQHRPNAVQGAAGPAAAGQKGGAQRGEALPGSRGAAPPRQLAGGENCIAPARRKAEAEGKGALHGQLYYSQMEGELTGRRYEEDDDTVVSKMISKEEFPLG